MNKVKTVGRRMTWQGCEGRVRAAVVEFERVRVFQAGSERAMEGAVFVERLLVLNVGRQLGVWLRVEDVRDFKALLERLTMDSGDVCDDDRHKPTGRVVLDTDGRTAIGEREEQVRSITWQHDRECLARNADVLAAAARLAGEGTERDAENEAEDDPGEDAEEERGERQRLIQRALWRGFEPLQSLPDTRKLPDAIRVEHPVSALSLTQWNNYDGWPETA
jgi:hypothetical protein